MGFLEILNVLALGWFVGFMSFAFIDILCSMRKMKRERVRHDMEIARIKAARSVRA